MVVIDSGPLEATHKPSDVSPKKWIQLMHIKRDYMAVRLTYDCRCLLQFVQEAEEMYGECGFASADEMIRNGYELEPAEVAIAIDWLKINSPKDAVPFDYAIGKWGTNRHSRGRNPISSRGREYDLARLRRDRPDLATKVEADPPAMSANAAAIEAGFRKKPTPMDTIRREWKKLTEKERDEIKTW